METLVSLSSSFFIEDKETIVFLENVNNKELEKLFRNYWIKCLKEISQEISEDDLMRLKYYCFGNNSYIIYLRFIEPIKNKYNKERIKKIFFSYKANKEIMDKNRKFSEENFTGKYTFINFENLVKLDA